MAAFKCKMCGGTIEFEPGASIGVCDSCGTKQTLPRLDDDKRANLYDRANHFRRNNDFDKAMGIYEQILSEDADDAEAYWSLVLCRYGIEYVEDPATHKRVPTVNRAQYTSVFADADYKSAVAHADDAQRAIYEAEAKAIDEIQKGILEISGKEEPFDVFICYKETDASGRRTQDSVLANDLYHQLTQEGFKVFFARITLEDKLGSAYEPYIFAALNSAKVMVVLGTKPEYFNAVWVKNEWSRYLALVKQSGGKKMLIPAYKDMDPYDLPDEFSHLQAQDMAKLGFMQDLIRGIKKILAADSPKSAAKETVNLSANSSTAPLLKRVFLFLEDGNWAEADEYCEKVLDLDPECAEAYLGKLMAELQVKNQKELAECFTPFEDNANYAKVMRFGNSKLTAMLTECVATQPQKIAYQEALNAMSLAAKSGQKSKMYRDAGLAFSEIGDFKDAQALAQNCFEKAQAFDRYKIEQLKNPAVGDIVYFGKYEQDNDASNGAEDIEWIVLTKKEDSYLVISKYALDCKQYNETNESVTWQTSSLRNWLNNDFLNKAFTKEEINQIPTVRVTADENPCLSTNPGVATSDKIFLLSIKEAEQFFATDKERICIPTAYAKARGAATYSILQYIFSSDKYPCWGWWLRSPGWDQAHAAYVNYDGGVFKFGNCVNYDNVSVRPALWIKKAMSEKCLAEAENCVKQIAYRDGDYNLSCKTLPSLEKAMSSFEKASGWKDADKKIEECREKIAVLKAKEERAKIAAAKRAKILKKVILIGIAAVCVCIAFLVILVTVIIPNRKYNSAMKLYEAGKYSAAISAFEALNGYKDSAVQIENCNAAIKDDKYNKAIELYNAGNYTEAISAFEALNGYKDSAVQIENCYIKKYGEETWKKLKKINPGDTYTFGAYEQDNDASNGKEKIEWIVLDKKETSLLLISKQALDCRPYNTSLTDVTWETCSLRIWMNGAFLDAAFNEEEQGQIISTNVQPDKNPFYSTNPGNATTDKIFLLSIGEANNYFRNDEARKCVPTAYAKAQGAYTNSDYRTSRGEATCLWRLRSPGYDQDLAAGVNLGGDVGCNGLGVDYGNDGVRPALWITLNA